MSAPENQHQRHGAATDRVDGAVLAGGGYVVLGKMRWRTPPEIVAGIARSMGIQGFDLDAAAEDDCHCAPLWIRAEDDCLARPWGEKVRGHVARGGVTLVEGWSVDLEAIRHVFMNPPWGAAGISAAATEAAEVIAPGSRPQSFPGTEAFVLRAFQESRRGLVVAVLMPQALDTAWQRRVIQLADEVRIGPRIRFRDYRDQPGPAPPGGHLLAIYRPHVPENGWPGGPRVDWGWQP